MNRIAMITWGAWSAGNIVGWTYVETRDAFKLNSSREFKSVAPIGGFCGGVIASLIPPLGIYWIWLYKNEKD